MKLVTKNLEQVREMIRKQYEDKIAIPNASLPFGMMIESLLEQINLLGGHPTIYFDQWFLVRTEGTMRHFVNGEPECDFASKKSSESLILALIATYQEWKKVWEEINGRDWQDPSFTIIEQ